MRTSRCNASATNWERASRSSTTITTAKRSCSSRFSNTCSTNSTRTVSTEGHGSGEETLRFTVEALFPDADCHTDFDTAMLEMGMQAPYNDDFRDQFRTNDARLKDLFSHIVADGVERGEFEEIDPERAAEHLLILLDGARGRSVVLGTDAPNDVGRAAIRDFIGRITVGGDGE